MKELETFVKNAHKGQLRRGGEEPYYNHVKRVSELCNTLFTNTSSARVALLHDVVEDTSLGFEECFKHLETEEEKAALVLLTKASGESPEEYMKRLLNGNNMVALQVKFCDALDNATFSERGRRFTKEILGLDPDEESRKYLKRARLCLDRM